jgi:GTP-binding protein YchF
MDVKVAIIGIPKSGKTTIFNALTKGSAEVASYSPSLTPNMGMAKVPDSRLALLENVFHPDKTIPAEVDYVDMAGSPKTLTSQTGIAGEFLSYLTTADALLQVVRVFQDEKVPHPAASLDPKRDMATLDLELAFSDLTIIERRLDRLEASLRGAKTPEREQHLKEQILLQKIKAGLEEDIPIRQQDLSEHELRALSNYQFLTAKPMLIVLNIGEADIPRAAALESEISSLYPQFAVVALCGKLEMELSQLDETEANEFRESMGITAPALDQVVNLSYRLLGLISFFTTASAELKAWTIPSNTTASKAAGKVHSDMERGFIKAEVISYGDLEKCGNVAETRKRGLHRIEGKQYTIQDGDIVTFLFHV